MQQILLIQPKTYKYIDYIQKGDKTVYGFIAQQIKEVIPEAVSIQEEIIPNIYSIGINNNNTITFNNSNNVILNNNDEIDIFNSYGKKNTYKILNVVNENTFTVDKEIETNDVFIYGKKINDFHTISKEYIFTLNVCATQELYKLITKLQERVEYLENKLIRFF